VPEGSLITLVAALGGRPPGPLRLSHASASFELADEWVQLGTMVSDGAAFDPHVRGRVALDGRLDLTVDLMPVVEAFGGGAYAQASRYTTSLPVRIEGTAQAPELKPPALEDVARGLVGAAIERALTEPPGDP
jgi:hypothetical protein